MCREKPGDRAARERDAAFRETPLHAPAFAGRRRGASRAWRAARSGASPLRAAVGLPGRTARPGPPELLRQPGEFLVDDRLKIGPVGGAGRGDSPRVPGHWLGHDIHLLLAASAAEPGTARAFNARSICATPYNQFPTCSRGFTLGARRASTRKTAWNASSAVVRSPITRRQTPRTIGPCRRTSRPKESASRSAMNAVSSCPSLRSVLAPARTTRRRAGIRLACPVGIWEAP